jgi:hypothetical protein
LKIFAGYRQTNFGSQTSVMRLRPNRVGSVVLFVPEKF